MSQASVTAAMVSIMRSSLQLASTLNVSVVTLSKKQVWVPHIFVRATGGSWVLLAAI